MQLPTLLIACLALIAIVLTSSGCDAICGTDNVSYTQCIQPTLEANCIGDGCHGGDAPAAGLSLDGNAHDNTVGKAAASEPSRILIQPGKPEESYLFQKLLPNASITGQIMPLQRPPLSQPQIDMIRAWIQQGAKK